MSAARKTAAATTLPVLSDWYLRSRLKMRQICLLVALDEHRNVHRAAESLAMTQPAATRLLGDLEKLLGLRLFERSARGLTPNAYGESLIRHARVVLSALDHSRDEINALLLGTTGKIVVGTLLVAAPMLVPRAVARFKEQHPRHTVLIREGTTATLVEALRQGQLDLVVGRAWADFAGALRGLLFGAHARRRAGRTSAGPRRGDQARQARRMAVDLSSAGSGIPEASRSRFSPGGRRAAALDRGVDVHPDEHHARARDRHALRTASRRGAALCAQRRGAHSRGEAAGPFRPVGIITAAGRALPPAAFDLAQALREAARDVAALRY